MAHPLNSTIFEPTAAAVQPPTWEQMAAFVVREADSRLRDLIETRQADEHWDEDDNDVDLAVELALSRIVEMRCSDFRHFKEFSWPWLQVSSAINLAAKYFSRPGCRYARQLGDLPGFFRWAHAFVDTAEVSSREQEPAGSDRRE